MRTAGTPDAMGAKMSAGRKMNSVRPPCTQMTPSTTANAATYAA
jgi:hypothetical protein